MAGKFCPKKGNTLWDNVLGAVDIINEKNENARSAKVRRVTISDTAIVPSRQASFQPLTNYSYSRPLTFVNIPEILLCNIWSFLTVSETLVGVRLCRGLEFVKKSVTDITVTETNTRRLIATFSGARVVTGVKIHERGAFAMAAALAKGQLENLVKIELGDNGIKDRGVMAICSGLSSMQGRSPLEVLNLQWNDMSSMGGRHLAEALNSRACPRLNTLNLTGNHIGDEGVGALCRVMMNKRLLMLSCLTLDATGVSDVSVEALARAMAAISCPLLGSLGLGGNKKISDAGCEALTQALAAGCCPSLVAIDLSDNSIGVAGAPTLLYGLSANASSVLHRLDMGGNELNDDALSELCLLYTPSSSPFSCLSALMLYDNGIGNLGATHLASLFRTGAFPSLKQLDLSGNHIGDQGVGAIVDVLRLQACPMLSHLVLMLNCITDKGMSALAAAFAAGACSSLRMFMISWNEFGDAGVDRLAAAFRAGGLPQLGMLNIKGNDVSEQAVQSLKASFRGFLRV